MKKIIVGCLILVIAIMCLYFFLNKKESDNNVSSENNIQNIEESENMNDNEFVNEINVSIKGKDYTLTLEDNETSRELVQRLPLEITMTELNGNEKYYYFDESFPSNSKNPGTIHQGDVMLYGSDCLVVFYKSFHTSYSYTKIGHIDNLPNLGSGNIEIKFNK